jgi:hypothetical protein
VKRLLLLLAACGDTTVFVQPVYDLPVNDTDATPSGLETLTLSIAREGEPTDLVAQSFTPGTVVELANVPFGDNLVIHLAGLDGGADVAYGRSCSFSIAPDGAPPEPHVFFARNIKFASLDFMSGRTFGTALTDEQGGAIVLGGQGNNTVERFDPRTGLYEALTSIDARAGTVSALLGSGATTQVAVLGGIGARKVELISSDGGLEDVEDNQNTLSRTEMTATSLTDGRIVVIGGRGGSVSGEIAVIGREGALVEIRDLEVGLLAPRANHTATRLGDDVGAPVLIAGGVNGTGQPVAVAELFKPLSGDIANPATFAPEMVVPRHRHLARLLPDGSVLIIGGLDASNQPVRMLERFTIDAGFVAAGSLPPTAGVIEMSATTLPDGQLLLAGGRISTIGAPVSEAFLARVEVEDGVIQVVTTDRLAEARAGHQATLLCDGTVLVVGGTAIPSVAERYNPSPTNRR